MKPSPIRIYVWNENRYPLFSYTWRFQRRSIPSCNIGPQVFKALKTTQYIWINPLPASDAVRKQKTILEDLSVQYCHNLKNITPLKTQNLIIYIFQSLKFCFLIEKIALITLKPNFTTKYFGLLWIKRNVYICSVLCRVPLIWPYVRLVMIRKKL